MPGRPQEFAEVAIPSRRGRRIVRLSALALFCLGAACAPPPTEPPADEFLARGAEILAPFKRELLEALTGAMEQGGPVNALDVCRVEAPAIAAAAAGPGVSVGRTSHRLRNPANAPSDWLRPVLAAYVDGTADGAGLVDIDGGRLGYVEPIRVQPMCLACHGETLTPGVVAALEAYYPEDEATGFQTGDFRGLFWATFPRPE